MGVVETEARKKRRIGYIQLGILSAIAIAGVVIVAATAPNLPSGLARLPSIKRAQKRYQYRTAFGRLAADGYITFEIQDGKKYARLTEAGKKSLAFEQAKINLKNPGRRRWNGRWRVIIFDIPERRRRTRDRLRIIMQEVGFVRLQDSVWVFPYDCEDFVTLLKAELKIGAAILYMVVEQIENDKHLRAHFDLK